MKVALINPQWSLDEQYASFLSRVGSVEEPLGLAYVSAYLKEKGVDVLFIDALAQNLSYSDILASLRNFSPDIVGITALTPMIKRTTELAEVIKKNLKDVKIVIGGAHVSAMRKVGRPHELLKGPIDYAIFREGEETMFDLVESLENNKDLSKVDGLIWKEGSKVVVNKPRAYIENLDSLPFPDIDSLPLGRYRPTPSSFKRLPVRSIESSRGCPYNCTFCDRSVFGNKVRYMSIDRVMEYIDLMVTKYGAKELRFWDDTFTLSEERVVELCKRIVEKDYKVYWTCYGRVNTMTENMLRWMKKAGCWQIGFGVEAGNPMILKSIRKGFTKEQVAKVFKLVKKYRIETRAFFMLGHPNETEETIRQTIDFAIKLNPTIVLFNLTQAYPGTELYNIAVSQGGLTTKDWSKYLLTGEEATYVTPGLSKEFLEKMQKTAYRRFYIRPKCLLHHLKIAMSSISDMKRYVNSAIYFVIGVLQ